MCEPTQGLTCLCLDGWITTNAKSGVFCDKGADTLPDSDFENLDTGSENNTLENNTRVFSPPPSMGNGSEAPASTNGLAGSWGNDSFAHCNLNYTLHQLRQRESAGQSPNYRTGGLGRKMQPSIFEAWVCVDQHECISRTSVPTNDWFCWVINERIALPKERAPEQYVPWGHNGLLKLFEKEGMKILKNVTFLGDAADDPSCHVPRWLQEVMNRDEITVFSEAIHRNQVQESDLEFIDNDTLKGAGIVNAFSRDKILSRIKIRFKQEKE